MLPDSGAYINALPSRHAEPFDCAQGKLREGSHVEQVGFFVPSAGWRIGTHNDTSE